MTSSEPRETLDALFHPLVNPRSYASALYLLLSMPLGIFYLTFLSTGFGLGGGLSVILIGIPILVAVMAAARWLGGFERWLARKLLGVEFDPEPALPPGTWRQRAAALASDRQTWKTLAYLLARFPMGIAAFALVVSGTALSLALISTPFLYRWVPVQLVFWRITTLADATFAMAIGVVMAGLFLHAFLWLANTWSRFARLMLNPGSAAYR